MTYTVKDSSSLYTAVETPVASALPERISRCPQCHRAYPGWRTECYKHTSPARLVERRRG